MKKLTLILLLSALFYPLISQVSDEEKLMEFENGEDNGPGTVTATLTASTRLFENIYDLTSVIVVIPKGSSVIVLDSDSTYLHVSFEEDEGYIFKKHAVIDKTPVPESKPKQVQDVKKQDAPEPNPTQQTGRFSYLESKYGTSMATRISAGKIWKGMNAEMVKDSWGKAEKINREINGNTVKEEWLYNTTWLYLENNTLIDWGPVNK